MDSSGLFAQLSGCFCPGGDVMIVLDTGAVTLLLYSSEVQQPGEPSPAASIRYTPADLVRDLIQPGRRESLGRRFESDPPHPGQSAKSIDERGDSGG